MHKHHYIPIHYLKNFVNTNGHFYVYDKTKPWTAENPLHRSFNQICFEWNGNMMPLPDNKESKHIEIDYSAFDNKIAPVFKDFILAFKNNTKIIWTQDNVGLLEMFVNDLFFRIPSNTSFINNIFDHYTSLNDFGIHVGVAKKNGKTISDKNLAKALYKEPNMRLQLRSFLKNLPLNDPQGRYPDLEWRLFTTQSINQLSSDNPFQFHRIIKDFHHLRSEVVFPISPLLGLLRVPTFHPEVYPNPILLNLSLIESANQFVYSKDRESLKLHVKAYNKYLQSDDYNINYLHNALWAFTDNEKVKESTIFLKNLFLSILSE